MLKLFRHIYFTSNYIMSIRIAVKRIDFTNTFISKGLDGQKMFIKLDIE